ncbi:MAG: DKNYY domain-containing protein [Janthinobacterium lividum]
MNALQNVCYGIMTLLFISCSTGYKIERDIVYYEHWNEGSGQYKDEINADSKTFKILRYGAYAKDAKSVFYEGKKIVGADANTFEALGEFYAKDKNSGWYGNDVVESSNGKTFKIINLYYSTDGFDIFFVTKPLKMAKPNKFKFVYGEGDSDSWTTDGEYYYYNSYRVPSSDYENLKIYPGSGGLSKDKQWVYFLNHKLNYDEDGNKVVDTIDVASFEATGFIECRDKYGCFNVYHGREKCKN